MKTFKSVLACLLAGALLSGCSNDKKIVEDGVKALKTYETLQQAYIAEHDKIGTAKQITFYEPTSDWFLYVNVDDPVFGLYGCEAAVLKQGLGDCPEKSTWITCVPKGTAEVQRRVSSAACAELSPERFKTVGTVEEAALAAGMGALGQ